MIAGSVRETGSRETIPFANLVITNSNYGAAANASGNFMLRIPQGYGAERIKVSSIGYRSRYFSVDSLLKASADLIQIELSADVSLLDELVVNEAPIDPREVVSQAIAAIPDNYRQEPFNMEALSIIHSRDSLTGNQYKVEALMRGYYDGYRPGNKRKFEIMHKRTTGQDPLKELDYGYWPSFELGSADVLADQFKRGIFNPEYQKDFQFKYGGVSLYEDDTVYQIEYDLPRPTAKITGYGIVPETYRGTIFITVNSHAVVRHEIVTSSFRYNVVYRKIRDQYFPYYFSGTRLNDFKLGGVKRKFRTTNEVIVTNIILEDVRPIDPRANETNVDKVAYDEQFWNTNFPVRESGY